MKISLLVCSQLEGASMSLPLVEAVTSLVKLHQSTCVCDHTWLSISRSLTQKAHPQIDIHGFLSARKPSRLFKYARHAHTHKYTHTKQRKISWWSFKWTMMMRTEFVVNDHDAYCLCCFPTSDDRPPQMFSSPKIVAMIFKPFPESYRRHGISYIYPSSTTCPSWAEALTG